jgi:hypothetical protein
MPANDKQRFDYSNLPAEKAEKLRSIAVTLSPLLKELRITAVQAGRQLRAAKEILKHGGFGSFCQDVMSTEVRMCQLFINVADLADDLGSEIVEKMPVSSAALLSKAPPEIVGQVVDEMNEGGKCPSLRKIRARIRTTQSSGKSVATVGHDDERVANLASVLTKKLETQELSDLLDVLNAAKNSSIVALCEKIQSYLNFPE